MEKRGDVRLTSLPTLVLLNDTGSLVDLGRELLLGHRLSLSGLGLHSSFGHGDSDAARRNRNGSEERTEGGRDDDEGGRLKGRREVGSREEDRE